MWFIIFIASTMQMVSPTLTVWPTSTNAGEVGDGVLAAIHDGASSAVRDYVSDSGTLVELVGKEKVEGSDAYKLKVTKKDGDVEYYFLDAESHLPIRVEARRTIRGTEIEGESTIGDYKEVDGLIFAHSIEQKPKGAPAGASTRPLRMASNGSGGGCGPGIRPPR